MSTSRPQPFFAHAVLTSFALLVPVKGTPLAGFSVHTPAEGAPIDELHAANALPPDGGFFIPSPPPPLPALEARQEPPPGGPPLATATDSDSDSDGEGGGQSKAMTVIVPIIIAAVVVCAVLYFLIWGRLHARRARDRAAAMRTISAEELATAPLNSPLTATEGEEATQERPQRRRRGLNLAGGLGRSESGRSILTLPEYTKDAREEETVLLRRDPSLSGSTASAHTHASHGHSHAHGQDPRRMSEQSGLSVVAEGAETDAPLSWGAAPSYDLGYEYGFGDRYAPPDTTPPASPVQPRSPPQVQGPAPARSASGGSRGAARSTPPPSRSATFIAPRSPLSASPVSAPPLSLPCPASSVVDTLSTPSRPGSAPPSRAASVRSSSSEAHGDGSQGDAGRRTPMRANTEPTRATEGPIETEGPMRGSAGAMTGGGGEDGEAAISESQMPRAGEQAPAHAAPNQAPSQAPSGTPIATSNAPPPAPSNEAPAPTDTREPSYTSSYATAPSVSTASSGALADDQGDQGEHSESERRGGWTRFSAW